LQQLTLPFLSESHKANNVILNVFFIVDTTLGNLLENLKFFHGTINVAENCDSCRGI